MSLIHQPEEIIQDKYRVTGVLGRGGVAVTYSAIDFKTNSSVAIKVISLKQLDNWKQVELFQREAEVLKQLEHSAIPQYIDYFDIETETDKAFYLVQQIAPGNSLHHLVESGWRANETEVKNIAQQVLEILQYLHSLDPPVIHRDIKPHNIIRDDKGKIYLVDFGAVQNTYYNTLMQGSTVVGTYGYMSPEQFQGKALPATDLYSLGATLLYLLTHRSPAELPQDTLKLDFRNSVNISDSFADWLEKILEPDFEDRFDNAEIALSELNKSQKKKQRKLMASIIAIALLVGLLAGINSYKWFFLSYLGFYPNNLCNVEKEESGREFFQQGGSINFINIKNIKKNEDTMLCLLKIKLSEKNLDTAQLIVRHYHNNLQLNRYLFHWIQDPEIIEFLLINSAANPNATDNLGNTPLFYAAEHRYINHENNIYTEDHSYFRRSAQHTLKYSQVAKLLIEAGANVNFTNRLGETPLFAAVKTEDIELIKLLIEYGAEVNATNKDGATPLLLAISKGKEDIVEALTKHDININYKGDNGGTYLTAAIRKHQPEIVKILIDRGADINIKNDDGRTPLHIATAYGMNTDIAKIIVASGADIDAKDKYEETPMYRAIYRGRKDMVAFLVENGAKVNVKDKRGHTPLSTAIVNLQPQIIQYLVDNGADTHYLNYDVVKKEHYISSKTSKLVEELLEKNNFKAKNIKN